MYPHDPRYRTDIQNFPRSPLGREQGGVGGEARPQSSPTNGAAPGPGMASVPGMDTATTGKVPRSTALEDPIGARGPQPPSFPRGPVTPEVRAARASITPEILETMGAAVDKVSTLEDADAALAGIAKKAGIPPEALPDSLLKALYTRFQARQNTPPTASPEERFLASGAEEGSMADLPTEAGGGVLDEGEPAVARTRPAENPLVTSGNKAIAEKRAQGRRSLSERITENKPKRWKRMPPEEQKGAEKALKEAVAKATRHDFHGALAPTLRKLGIDLGSIPKDVAKRLRDALKKERAKKS